MRTRLTVGIGMMMLMGRLSAGPVGFAEESDPGGNTEGRDALPQLVLVPPGTAIGNAPPSGWTHLVLKSVPTLATGDLETLPPSARKTATLFRTVILAEVRPPSGREAGHTLRRIGVGLAVPVNGVDTVVTSSRLNSLRIALGLMPRKVLERAEEELGKGRIQGRTATFALFTAPTEFKFATGHAPASLRYAFLVEPRTGGLRTLVWVAADRAALTPATGGNLLASGLVFDCGLDVAADRLFNRIPVYWSFALGAAPPGQRVTFPDSLRPWTIHDSFTPAESVALEAELRKALPETGPLTD